MRLYTTDYEFITYFIDVSATDPNAIASPTYHPYQHSIYLTSTLVDLTHIYRQSMFALLLPISVLYVEPAPAYNQCCYYIYLKLISSPHTVTLTVGRCSTDIGHSSTDIDGWQQDCRHMIPTVVYVVLTLILCSYSCYIGMSSMDIDL